MRKTLVFLLVLAFGLLSLSSSALADPPSWWFSCTTDSGGSIDPPPPDDGGWIDPTTQGSEDPPADDGTGVAPKVVANDPMLEVSDWLLSLFLKVWN